MDITELEQILREKGFTEKKQDTGIKYTISDNHIKLICYVEPGIEVEFISIYKWSNNDVKGTYNVSVDNLKRSKEPLPVHFQKTKNNMPEYIGETINVHREINHFIDKIF